MAMFDSVTQRDIDQIAIAVTDWPTYAGKTGRSTFLAELLNGTEENTGLKFAQGFAQASVTLDAGAVNGDARQHLLNKLQQHITVKLGFSEAIEPDQPLNEVGLDSLMSVSLSNSLEDEFGIPVPIAELISGPTINQLVDSVFVELVGSLPTERNQPRDVAAVAAARVTGGAIAATAKNEHRASATWADNSTDEWTDDEIVDTPAETRPSTPLSAQF